MKQSISMTNQQEKEKEMMLLYTQVKEGDRAMPLLVKFKNRLRFVQRNERFGFTFFDRKKLRHTFLRYDNPSIEKEKWHNELKDSPSDLLYSPIRVYMEMTNKCNLRCKHCFNSSGKPFKNELSIDEWIKVMEGIRKDYTFDVRVSGGEITVMPGWYEILKAGKNQGLSVSCNTNGVYDNPEDIYKKFDELNLEQITFSLDGDREHHDYIRGKGTFDKIVTSMKELKNRGHSLRINTVTLKGTENSIDVLLELASQYCEEINFFYMRLFGRAVQMADKILGPDELVAIANIIASKRKKYPNLNILEGSQVLSMNSVSEDNTDLALKYGLPDGFTRISILADGAVTVNCYLQDFGQEQIIGNIKDEGFSFINLWRNSGKLNNIRQISRRIQERCQSCADYKNNCKGTSLEMELFKQREGRNPYCRVDNK